MKFVAIALMLVCAINAGVCIGVHNYGYAALNFLLVVLNFYSYKRACLKEEE